MTRTCHERVIFLKIIAEKTIGSKIHFILLVVSPFSDFQESHFNQKPQINDLSVNLSYIAKVFNTD